MLARDFAHVETWVFDLDNTLYPPGARLFEQIEVRMTAWVSDALGVAPEEADRLRKAYWQSHGTTLAGLMEVHGVEPAAYLAHVHDISFDALSPDPDLGQAIARLPGRRIVYTNATRAYAAEVLAALGLTELFDALYGVEEAAYQPKPRADAFRRVFAADGLAPERAAMFEDDPRNLAAPHAMGMRTIHVAPAAAPAPHIHHHTSDLAGFLRQIAA